VQGGALATLLDVTTTLALLKLNQAKTVSVEMNMSYLSPAPLNKELFVRAEALRFGRSLCYSQAEVYDEKLKMLYTGRHVKAVVPGSFLD
jgi:acyl-coenzyme A thioesterase 13